MPENTHTLCVSGDFFSTFSLDNNVRAQICSWHFVCSVLAHANYENINASAYCDDFISMPSAEAPNKYVPYVYVPSCDTAIHTNTHMKTQSNTRATCKRLRDVDDDDYYILTRIALESAHTHTTLLFIACGNIQYICGFRVELALLVSATL